MRSVSSLICLLLLLSAASVAGADDAVFAEPLPDLAPVGPEAGAPPDAALAGLEGLEGLEGLARAERLLAFAHAHPHDARTPAAVEEARALVAASARAPAPDPLVDALSRVFQPGAEGARLTALRAVAALGDVRAVAALAYVARRDGSTEARRLAAQSLGDLPSEQAQAAALALLRDGGETAPVRAAAAEALARQGTPSGADALAALVRDGSQPAAVREASLAALRRHHPSVAGTLSLDPVFDSTGRGVLSALGAASGAYTLGLVGSLSPNASVATPLGVAGGAVIGGTATYFLSSSMGMDLGDALYLTGAAAWSVPTGWLLGGALSGQPDASCQAPACNGVALGTHVAAMLGAWFVADRMTFTLEDNAEVNVAALSTLLMTVGTLQAAFPEASDRRVGAALTALAPAVGFAAGTALSPWTRASGPHLGLTGLSIVEGLLVASLMGGALIPERLEGPLGAPTFNPNRGAQITGLMSLGAGLGLAASLATSPFWNPRLGDIGLLMFGALDGHFLGASLPLLIAGEKAGEATGVTSAVLGLAAMVGTGLLIDPAALELDLGEAVLVALGTAFAGLQGTLWSSYLNTKGHVSAERARGLAFATVGVGGLAMLLGTEALKVEPWRASWAFAGAAWGGWLGGWGAWVLQPPTTFDSDAVMLSTLIGSAAGLGLSALLLSPAFDVQPHTFAWSSLFGVGGMTLFSLGAVFVSAPQGADTGRNVAIANVLGSVLGLAVGAGVAQFIPPVRPFAGSGGDAPFGLDVPLPTAAAMPVLDPTGQRMEGMGAQLVWAL